MSSTFNDTVYFWQFPSSHAVDGNRDPIASKMDNSCVYTESQTDPWWAVDLGAAVAVLGILFTNRAESDGIT